MVVIFLKNVLNSPVDLDTGTRKNPNKGDFFFNARDLTNPHTKTPHSWKVSVAQEGGGGGTFQKISFWRLSP